ncbi:Serine/threonine-protein phosphatase PP1-2 [Tritrichomonas foetus]|uniref:Serine/threonine-protein phosphatase n=1 Tax=Tritrichomonas foetus TaxID=1144522 RepID=A0A1J4KVG2_9EUKA|nr:Serine/threonine-protein phosphatase PP1-2 [Tritrichomonas foetus]|eukprot:OHT15297.1 Serine/threonine-protein phosphatase PP1-2 [Tritrichomonas foetus]
MFLCSEEILKQSKAMYNENYNDNGLGNPRTYFVPKFSQILLNGLIKESLPTIMNEPILLKITGDVIIVGDLHGNIFDLLRIFQHFYEKDVKFLFLGDYVDRGDSSIELITLLLALKNVYPDKYYLIRGNHEFSEVNEKYGFFSDIMLQYKNKVIWEEFNHLFNYLPIAAIVNNTNFCVHGGLSEHLKYINQIEKLKRPISDFSNPLIEDIMWNDPNCELTGSLYGVGSRGIGKMFGLYACKIFFSHNKPINRIIRAHQCIKDGISFEFTSQVVTVFSASNFELKRNKSAVLYSREDGTIDSIVYPALPKMRKRSQVVSQLTQSPSNTIINNSSMGYQTLNCFKSNPASLLICPVIKKRRPSLYGVNRNSKISYNSSFLNINKYSEILNSD